MNKSQLDIAELKTLEKKVKISLDYDKDEFDPLRRVNELVGILSARVSGGTDFALDEE